MPFTTAENFNTALTNLKDSPSITTINAVLANFENAQGVFEYRPELIQQINAILAPPLSSTTYHYARTVCPGSDYAYDDEWDETFYGVPGSSDIQACKAFGKTLLDFSVGAEGENARKLLQYFVEILAQRPQCSKDQEKYNHVMMSDLKFFHILRSVQLDNGTRPFNDLLETRASMDKLNGKTSAINTLLNVKTTSSSLQGGYFAAKSGKRVNDFAKLVGKPLQDQFVAQAKILIKELASQKGFLKSKEHNASISHQILAIGKLITSVTPVNDGASEDSGLLASEGSSQTTGDIRSKFEAWKDNEGHGINTRNLEIVLKAAEVKEMALKA